MALWRSCSLQLWYPKKQVAYTCCVQMWLCGIICYTISLFLVFNRQSRQSSCVRIVWPQMTSVHWGQLRYPHRFPPCRFQLAHRVAISSVGWNQRQHRSSLAKRFASWFGRAAPSSKPSNHLQFVCSVQRYICRGGLFLHQSGCFCNVWKRVLFHCQSATIGFHTVEKQIARLRLFSWSGCADPGLLGSNSDRWIYFPD